MIEKLVNRNVKYKHSNSFDNKPNHLTVFGMKPQAQQQ